MGNRIGMKFLFTSLAFGLSAISANAAESAAEFTWSNVSMGGGGFVSSVIASSVDENLFYARTDVGGAYRWDETSSRWVSLMDWVDATELGLLGVEAIAVDPKESGTVYMMAGTSYWNSGRTAFLRSKDRGDSWDVIYTWDEDGTKGKVVKGFGAHGNGMGRGNGEALAIDPNDSKNMFYGTKNKGLWKSTDNGSTWSHVAAWTKAAGSDTTWNGSGFSFVQYAPGSSDVIYAGFLREGSTSGSTFENVFTSTDGGESWKALPIPDSLRTTAGAGDKSKGGKVRLMPQRAVVASDGSFLMVTFADGAGPHTMAWDEGWGMINDGFGRGAVLKYDVANGTWSDASPENLLYYDGAKYDETDYASGNYQYCVPYGGISINPNNSKEIVISTEGYGGAQYWKLPSGSYDMDGQWGTQIYYSTDGGETWVQSFAYNVTTTTMDENGIGWMNNSSIHWSGSVAIDPFNSKRVFVSSGNGVFRTDDITAFELAADPYVHSGSKIYDAWGAVTNNQVWKVSSHGIEETVPYEIVSIPGGPAISVIADYDGFRHDDIVKYPSTRHNTSVDADRHLGSTYGLAYAPKSGKLVKVSAARAYEGKYNDIPYAPLQYSTDSATSWSVETYTGPDASYKGGTAAISADGAVALWVPSEGTTNVMRNSNSTTWANVSGLTASGNLFIVGDPEDANVFYAYDRSTGVFYTSSDQGVSFAKTSEPGVSNDKKFRAIPGKTGDLWLPIAVRDENGNPKSGSLKHSTDGGKTWSDVAGVGYCEAVGYGVSKNGSGYPAIYAFGKVGDVLGVYGSDDEGATWTRVNDDGHEYGGLANGEFIMGDMNTYGVVYMSTAGRGIAARVPSNWEMGTSSSEGATTIPEGDTENSDNIPSDDPDKKSENDPDQKTEKIAPQVANSHVVYAHGNLELRLSSASARVSVFDMQGKMLSSKVYSNSVSIPVKSLVNAKGNYFVQINDGKRMLFNNRIVISR